MILNETTLIQESDSIIFIDSVNDIPNSDGVYLILGNSSADIISNDTIFTVIVTVSIFIFGYIVNRVIEKNKERNRLKQLYYYYVHLIQLLKAPIEKQAEALVKFALQLKIKEDSHIFVNTYSAFSLNLVTEISNEDLYQIFMNQKKGILEQRTDIYKKLNSNTIYLNRIERLIKQEFQSFVEKFESYNEKYKSHLQKTSEAFDRMLVSNSINDIRNEDDRFLMDLDQLRANWINNHENYRDIYVSREYYIDPLMTLCRQYQGDQRAIQILQDALNCVYAMDNLIETKWIYRREFTLTARKMRTALREILKSLEDFRNLK